MLYSHNTNTSGNIIKHNLRTSKNEQTHFFIKISLSHLILKRVDVSVVCERWVERYILREKTSLHIFWEPRGANACTPLASSSKTTSDWLCVPHLTAFSALSKSHHMVLIRWSPTGYTPVQPECPDTRHLPVYESKCDSLPKHMGSLEMNQKSMSYVI